MDLAFYMGHETHNITSENGCYFIKQEANEQTFRLTASNQLRPSTPEDLQVR